MKVPDSIVPLELTWKLIFHVPIYLYMFWVAYQKVRKGIRAARENIKRKPNVAMRNPNWQWLLGIPYFLAPFYSIILLTATTTYMQMDPSFQLSLSGCIQEQNPVMQNPLSISCLRAIDYAVLIFFTVFMLSGLVLFVFRIINKKIGLVPELSDDFSFKIKKRRKQMYSWNSDDGLDQPLASANVNASANIDSGKVQLHSVQEKETGRVVPKGNPVSAGTLLNRKLGRFPTSLVPKAVKSRSHHSLKSAASGCSEVSPLIETPKPATIAA